jgi:hypothetical protein
VTIITSYRIRYAVPVEDNDLKTVEHLKALVADDQVDEFSQLWLGDQIIDARVVDEQQMLEMFDAENEYLKGWSTEQKIDFVKKSLINA